MPNIQNSTLNSSFDTLLKWHDPDLNANSTYGQAKKFGLAKKVLEPVDGQGIRKQSVQCTYRKVASSKLSRLVAHPSTFRMFRKGKFDAYCDLKFSKLNSRLVYCSRLYGTYSWPKTTLMQMVHKNNNKNFIFVI